MAKEVSVPFRIDHDNQRSNKVVNFKKKYSLKMSIENIKIDLVQRLLTIESEDVLQEIEKILDRDVEVNPTLQKAIKEGLENIKNGETKTHSEVRKLYDKWI